MTALKMLVNEKQPVIVSTLPQWQLELSDLCCSECSSPGDGASDFHLHLVDAKVAISSAVLVLVDEKYVFWELCLVLGYGHRLPRLFRL